MSTMMFPPLPRIQSGMKAIRIDSSTTLREFEKEMAETCPTPRKVVKRKSRLAEILKAKREPTEKR